MSDARAVDVDCYAGYWGNETPRRFTREDQLVEILAVVDQWRQAGPPVLPRRHGRG
jgi:hypothetical protein